jgi:hypothetical protein
VNSVAVGPVPGFLIDENWIEEMLEQDRVCVDAMSCEEFKAPSRSYRAVVVFES